MLVRRVCQNHAFPWNKGLLGWRDLGLSRISVPSRQTKGAALGGVSFVGRGWLHVVEVPRHPILIPCRATTSSTRRGVIWLQPFKWKSVTAARHRSKSFGSGEAKPTGGPSSARRAISRNSSQSRATATSAIRPARRQSRASVVISMDRILCSPGMPSISSLKKSRSPEYTAASRQKQSFAFEVFLRRRTNMRR
jgi:hypothetical protein